LHDERRAGALNGGAGSEDEAGGQAGGERVDAPGRRYLAACRARGPAIRTVREAYRYPLHEVFLPFCAEEEITEPGQVTKRMLDRLTTRLLDTGGKKGPLQSITVGSGVAIIPTRSPATSGRSTPS
jgi:hypothetical protein